jgi:4-amino-4-deoxy-L-arabinose transferase-like glycosyltransferase
VNILAFHIFITGGAGLLDPMLLLIVALALYLLWVGRKNFAGLLN